MRKIRSGELRPGDTAIDATSGNTGRAYAGILQPLGIKLKLVVQSTLPVGKLGQLRIYGEGVELILHSGPESTVERARHDAAEFGYVPLDQYANEANPEAHETYTAQELWNLTGGGHNVAAVIIPLGTCGTAIGFSRFFKKRDKRVQIIGVAIDPAQEVPQIPGMRTVADIEKNVRLPWDQEGVIDQIRLAQRDAAIRGARRLAYIEPSWPGLSTGAAYSQALMYINEIDNRPSLPGKRVIIVSPDSIEPYVDIMNAEQDDADIGRALSSRPEF